MLFCLFLFVVVVFCKGASTDSAHIQLLGTSVSICLECSCNYRFFSSLELTAFSNLPLQADYLPIKLSIKLGKMILKLKKKKKEQLSFFFYCCSNSLSKPSVTEEKASYLHLENKQRSKFLYKAVFF